MTGLGEKIRNANFVGLSMLLHSSAIIAIAVGPQYFPEMMGDNSVADEDTIEFTVLEDASPQPEPVVDTVAVVEPVKVKPAPAPAPEPEPVPVVEPAPKPAPVAKTEEVSQSNELPEKDAEVAPAVAEEPEAEQTAEPLTDESEVLAAQKQKEEEERLALEERLAAVEAARAAEQAEIEKLREEQERLAQEKAQAEAEAQALAEQAEAARIQKEQEELAAAEKAAAEAAAQAQKLAEAKKAAEAAKKGQGAGSGEKIYVDQDYRTLSQAPGNAPPQYTTNMRLNKVEGKGQLVYYVNKDGSVSKMKLVKSSGNAEADQVAMDAFSKYKFVPGQAGYTVHNFQFKLNGPAKAHKGRLRAKN